MLFRQRKSWTTWRKAFLEIVGNIVEGLSQRSRHLIDLVIIPRLWYAIIIVRLLNPLARLIVLICCVISNFCVIFNKSMNYFVSTPIFISVRSQDFQFLYLFFSFRNLCYKKVGKLSVELLLVTIKYVRVYVLDMYRKEYLYSKTDAPLIFRIF